MEFFRKYQRPILFTAVLFALVTFSITGDMLSFFGSLFRDPIPTATIRAGTRIVNVDEEDYRVARAVQHRVSRDYVRVLPNISSIDPNDDYRQQVAALRRHAVASGVEASYDEVDRAIAATAANHEIDPRQLSAGFSSFDAYRAALYESMRLATAVRLQALALVPSDHEVAELALKDQERVTVRVATLDKEKIEERLGTELDASENAEQTLREWLDGLELTEKRQNGFVGANRLQLEIAALKIEAFDPEQFAAELEGVEIGEAEARQYYEQHNNLYELEEPDPETGAKVKPFEDEAVRADVERRLRAEAVMRSLWDDLQRALFAELQGLVDVRSAEFAAKNAAQTARDEAKIAAEADPENEELAAALEAAEQALEQAEDAFEAADEAVAARRTAWDMPAKLRELVGERSGFEILVSGEEPLAATDLSEIEGLGEWTNSWSATGMKYVGQLSSQVQSTDSHVFMFRVLQLVENPVKDYEEIADEVRTRYLKAEADEVAKQRREAFEAALERLGREARAAQIAELEAKLEQEVETELTEWRDDLRQKIEETQRLHDQTEGERAKRGYARRLEELNAQLAKEEAKREEIHTKVELDIETQIDDEIAETHLENLETAAAEAEFEVATVGPHLRQPVRRGPIAHLPKLEQFLFYQGRLREIEAGESTGVLEDPTNRAIHLAIVTAVEPALVADLSRRDLLEARMRNRYAHVADGVRQSFSLEALGKRIEWTPPGEEKIEAAAATGSSSDAQGK